jgi:hypothetical protein
MSEVFLTREEIEHPYANLTVMLEDKRRKAEQMRRTVFARITSSPEALAEKLVFAIGRIVPDYNHVVTLWYSTIIPDITFETRTEAIAATVAKLKEVCDE